jgi:syntaxin-binding protein 1
MAEAIVERKSIAETTKRVFLEDIFRKCNNSGTFILILDERTLPVLKRSLTKFEIMSEGCGVIENLHESRASQSDAEVIYFIEPSKKNIEALLEDFDTKPAVYKATSCWEKLIYGDITLPSIKQNKYGRVHLVFQGSVPDALYTRIKANKVLLSVLCSFREVHMDFQVIEKNIFSLGQAGGVEHLWGRMGDGPGMIRAIARQLMNVCVTMNEYPFIRYKAGYPCEEIAMAFQNEIDNYQRSHEKWQFLPERATVFIVDRTNDPLSPFLHEFTYQAMVYDLLDIKNDTYKYQAETGKGMVDKTVLLQDSDSMWSKHKHSNIYETQKDLQTSLKAFMEEHKAFQMLQSGQKDMLDMETLNKTVAGLPEYQENISVFSRHITITKHAMNVFTSSKLQAAALLEQTLATGFDQDKKAVKVAELYKNLQVT